MRTDVSDSPKPSITILDLFTAFSRRPRASIHGSDPTDYTASPSARSFVPYYTQRLSTTCVMAGARGIQKSLKSVTAKRCRAAAEEQTGAQE